MKKATSKNGRRRAAKSKKEERPTSELGRKLRKLREEILASGGGKPLTIEDLQRENWDRW